MIGSTTVRPGGTALHARLETVPGIRLGLLTGNVAEGAAVKLRSARSDPARFIVGAYGSDAAQRPALPAIAALRAEPHFGRIPAGHDVVIIGDTPADVTCGRSIGSRAIGVATGSYSVAQLLEAGAHSAFPHLRDTKRVLAVLLP